MSAQVAQDRFKSRVVHRGGDPSDDRSDGVKARDQRLMFSRCLIAQLVDRWRGFDLMRARHFAVVPVIVGSSRSVRCAA